MSLFKKAERKRAKLKIAITGPSGSGKTYSALQLATGLGKKIAVIDTENDSASLYADKFDFDTLNIEPPFTAKKYIDAIEGAEKAGYEVLIIDSLSHVWAGEGGILERKGNKDEAGGNSYTNWNEFTKEHERLKAALIYSDLHLIGNMRSKQDYIMETNEKGKQAPRKVGLAPVQREGMEYEFTVVFDISMSHNFHVSKDRTGLFDSRREIMKPSHGEELIAWLNGAAIQEPPKAIPFTKPAPKTDSPIQPPKVLDEPGEYVITFGKEFTNKKVKDVPIEKLEGMVRWCIDKKITDIWATTFIANVEAFVAQQVDQMPKEEFV